MNATDSSHCLSVIIPMYNEQDCVQPMLSRVHEALNNYRYAWELIVVDDGSSDATVQRLRQQAAGYGDHVRIIELQRNFGQSAAMQAGIDAARGDVIATLDGDLQNDPADIPRMVARLLDEDLDLVAGWRKARKDNRWLRTIPSRIANRLIGITTGVRLHDYGCSLKIYRAAVFRHVRLYGQMHRFIPAWMSKYTSPARIREEVVTHHARTLGTSKYNLSRTSGVLLDLLAVLFFIRFSARPGHFFGSFGLVFGLAGSVILGYLLVLKIIGEDIGNRPLLLTGILLVVMSLQFLTTGVLSELIARIYYEAGPSDSKAYILRETMTPGEPGWKKPD